MMTADRTRPDALVQLRGQARAVQGGLLPAVSTTGPGCTYPRSVAR